MNSWLIIPQNRIGAPGLVALLLVASIITPLSLDMYTPAVPRMTAYFGTTDAMVNLTIMGYYLFYSIGILVFGPISDKHGRKPVLMGGIAVYAAASAACAMAWSIEALIAFRIVQACGAGAMNAMATAIVKDAFSPAKREAVLSIIQVMFVVGPVAAPVIGALILQVADWHATFWTLAGIAAACLVVAAGFRETLPAGERRGGSTLASLSALVTVAKNPGFSAFVVLASSFEVAFMAYVAVASHIYITFFGLTEFEYSLFFAVAALITAVAPLPWLVCQRHMAARRFFGAMLVVPVAMGALMIAFGELSPFAFCAAFVVFSFAMTAVRPMSTNILLSQQEGDTGAAASVINFCHTILGVVGIGIAVLPWPNYVFGIGVIIVATMAAALVGWTALLRSDVRLKGIKDEG